MRTVYLADRVRCQCPTEADHHKAHQCKGRAVHHVTRDGVELWVCVNCILTTDVKLGTKQVFGALTRGDAFYFASNPTILFVKVKNGWYQYEADLPGARKYRVKSDVAVIKVAEGVEV